ncbi:hypothetical protein [Bradyrhizobium sp. th.b2]|uniref:hypothetical protein n=1 Tax=Bradyrhizobium sp. th-b2 TaxID=172088 RepID=UPI00040821A6|nr:hypothetical protein [Bradyrhizobium sp. th.b2]
MARAAAFREAVTFYWAKAQGMLTNWKVKVIAALIILVVTAGYAYHLGEAGKSDLQAQVRQLKEDLAQADERSVPQPEIPYWQCNGPKETRHPQCPDDSAADEANQREDELKKQLSESEAAKANLQKKVKDYETQLARRHAKGRGLVLSPADARSLSNIR